MEGQTSPLTMSTTWRMTPESSVLPDMLCKHHEDSLVKICTTQKYMEQLTFYEAPLAATQVSCYELVI